MKRGKLTVIGNSVGVVIARPTLHRLGWMPGDLILQDVQEDRITLHNVNRTRMLFTRTRGEHVEHDLSE